MCAISNDRQKVNTTASMLKTSYFDSYKCPMSISVPKGEHC